MKEIIIFSVSAYGRAVYRKLKDNANFSIKYFVDNDSHKQGMKFDGVSIVAPNELTSIPFDQIIIAGRSIEEQINQTKELGISYSKIKVMKKHELSLNKAEREKKNDKINEILTILIPLLDKNNIDYWFDYSSLLSLFRSNDLAEFSDIDIALNSSDTALKLWTILESSSFKDTHLIDCKTYPIDTAFSKKGDAMQITIISKGQPWEEHAIFDIHTKYLDKDQYKHIISPNVHFCPSTYLNGHNNFNYNIFELRIPKDVESYLSLLYGKDWISPAEFWTSSSYGNIDSNS
jgi:hypothetical protein|tara:strand:- start:1012 stop:1881 length:870 start_codon:yes stop_codon:yes gene_type:complete